MPRRPPTSSRRRASWVTARPVSSTPAAAAPERAPRRTRSGPSSSTSRRAPEASSAACAELAVALEEGERHPPAPGTSGRAAREGLRGGDHRFLWPPRRDVRDRLSDGQGRVPGRRPSAEGLRSRRPAQLPTPGRDAPRGTRGSGGPRSGRRAGRTRLRRWDAAGLRAPGNGPPPRVRRGEGSPHEPGSSTPGLAKPARPRGAWAWASCTVTVRAGPRRTRPGLPSCSARPARPAWAEAATSWPS